MRLTEADLAAIKKKREQWEKGATITTHTIAQHGESNPKNRRGGRTSKFGNIKAEAEGIKFASRKEMRRWMDLRLEEVAGTIKDLKRQVRYPLDVNGVHVCDYIADATYERAENLVVEDSKGYRTPLYALKAKLMLACHGITVLET